MIHYVAGKLAAVGEKSIVIDHQGIGLEILVPASVVDGLPAVGSDIMVYTYFHVKEDGMKLFGFLSRQDKELFQQIITVSGIGPKGGLAMMSALSSEDIRMAILSEDAKTIAMSPGIGPKTAKKLILELKDKIDVDYVLHGISDDGEADDGHRDSGSQENHEMIADTVDALTALGYSPTDAMRAVRNVPLTEDMTVEKLLKLTLKNM